MTFIYLLIYISALALFFSYITPKHTAVKTFVIMSFVGIGILIAFRGQSVGADTDSYYRLYNEINNNIFKHYNAETGYIYLVKFLSLFSTHPQTIFIFEAILVGVSYSYFIIKNVLGLKQAYIAILSYLAFNLFSFNLSGVRQSIAMCICLFAYEMIKNKKLIKFIILVAIASFFHTSAWLFLPAYFVAHAKEIKVAISVGLFSLFGVASIGTLIRLISSISERYKSYTIEKTDNGYIFFAIMTVILVFYLFFRNKLLRDDSSLQTHSKINYICYSLWVLRLLSRVVERPSFYYLPSTMIILSRTAEEGIIGNKRLATMYFIGLSGALMILFLYRIKGFNYVFC